MEYYINVYDVTRFKEPYKFTEIWRSKREAAVDANVTHDGERYHYIHTVQYIENKSKTIDLRN